MEDRQLATNIVLEKLAAYSPPSRAPYISERWLTVGVALLSFAISIGVVLSPPDFYLRWGRPEKTLTDFAWFLFFLVLCVRGLMTALLFKSRFADFLERRGWIFIAPRCLIKKINKLLDREPVVLEKIQGEIARIFTHGPVKSLSYRGAFLVYRAARQLLIDEQNYQFELEDEENERRKRQQEEKTPLNMIAASAQRVKVLKEIAANNDVVRVEDETPRL